MHSSICSFIHKTSTQVWWRLREDRTGRWHWGRELAASHVSNVLQTLHDTGNFAWLRPCCSCMYAYHMSAGGRMYRKRCTAQVTFIICINLSNFCRPVPCTWMYTCSCWACIPNTGQTSAHPRANGSSTHALRHRHTNWVRLGTREKASTYSGCEGPYQRRRIPDKLRRRCCCIEAEFARRRGGQEWYGLRFRIFFSADRCVWCILGKDFGPCALDSAAADREFVHVWESLYVFLCLYEKKSV